MMELGVRTGLRKVFGLRGFAFWGLGAGLGLR